MNIEEKITELVGLVNGDRATKEYVESELRRLLRPEGRDAERLKKIAGRLNGVANAMASCPGFTPIPQQLTYWREVVEEAYDIARGDGSPQNEESKP